MPSTSKYGYLLLLAVDNNGKTKGYSVVPVDNTVVKEHAPEIGDIVSVGFGSTVDTVALSNLTMNSKYMYTLGDSEYPTPAVGDTVLNGSLYKLKDSALHQDITVRIGQHLTLFKVDDNDKIQEFKRFIVKSTDIKQGSAVLNLVNNPDNIISEGNIVNGGIGLKIKLTNAKWSHNIEDKSIRDELFRGLTADNNASQWFGVIAQLISDGGGILVTTTDTSRDTLTFYLAKSPEYDISTDQKISLKIQSQAIEGAINPIQSTGEITIKPTIKASISGDVTSRTIRERDLANGGVDIIIKLLDGNWVGSIDKDMLINGFLEKNEDTLDTNWEKIKASYRANGKLIRNSSKELTLTLPAVTGLNLGNLREDISVNIPKQLIQGANIDVGASPMFSIYPDILKIEAKSNIGQDTVTMQAPDGKEILKDHNTWQIQLTNSTFIDTLTNKDIVIANLPNGLKYNVERVSDTRLNIKLSGVASTPITDIINISVIIKGSAVKENNSEDSQSINLKIKVNEAISFDGIAYELKDDGIYLSSLETLVDKIEYSIDSTNGINGTWKDVDVKSKLLSSTLSPIRICVREKLQTKVFKEIVDLKYGEIPSLVKISSITYTFDDVNNSYEKKVTVTGIDKDMDYSLDGGINWISLSPDSEFGFTDMFNLDENSDLRFKKSMVIGENGTLPSEATKRINGLYLGNASLKVSSGEILNTNTSMEYSLNSTNGLDGAWKAFRVNEPPFEFVKGKKVYIREVGKKENLRSLGTIGQKDLPIIKDQEGNLLVTYNIGDGKIINSSLTDLEYKLGDKNWKILKATSIDEEVEFVAGNFDLRARGDDKNLASEIVRLITIPEAIDPPELKGDDNAKTIHYLDEKDLWKEIDDTFKYKLGSNGAWELGSKFREKATKDHLELNSIMVYVVKIGSKDRLPSNEKTLAFTKTMTFENVKYRLEKKALEGTNSNMEYSISSSDVKNGAWIKIIGDKVSIEPFEGMYLWIREKNKPATEKALIVKLERNEKPALADMDYDIYSNTLDNRSDKSLEYKIAGGEWIKIDAGETLRGINFKPGKVEFRQRATKDKMESHPVVKETIKAPLSGPDVKYSDIKNNIISINDILSSNSSAWKIFEYRIDPKESTLWRTGELLAGEDLSGNKKVEIRIAATTRSLASQITVINLRKNLDLEKVALSTHVSPPVLNGTTVEMEYQIYLNNGEKTGWKPCTDTNTDLPTWLKNNMGRVIKIEVRDGREYLTEDVFEVFIK